MKAESSSKVDLGLGSMGDLKAHIYLAKLKVRFIRSYLTTTSVIIQKPLVQWYNVTTD